MSILGLREYVLLSLKELPLIASAGPLFVGIVQGNVNLILFALGTAIVAPTAAGITGALLKYPFEWFGLPVNLWKVAASDVSPLLPEAPSIVGLRGAVNVVPTYWFTMSMFFFSYLALNAAALYNEPAHKGADADKVDNRKNQAIMSMILIVTLGLAILGAKVWLSGSETVLGIIVGLLVGGGSAYMWFKFLRQCGMGRLEDVFGIQARILPEAALGDAPVVCV